MFAKVFEQILDSTIAEDWQVRHVFEDLLKICDSQGYVDKTPRAIANRLNMPLDIVTRALAQLSEPDPESRSQEAEGRRIVLIDSHRTWGWRIVNHKSYRDIRDDEARKEYFKEAKRKQRSGNALVQSKNVQDSQRHSETVQECPAMSTHTEADTEAKANTTPLPPSRGAKAENSSLSEKPALTEALPQIQLARIAFGSAADAVHDVLLASVPLAVRERDGWGPNDWEEFGFGDMGVEQVENSKQSLSITVSCRDPVETQRGLEKYKARWDDALKKSFGRPAQLKLTKA